MLIKDAEEDVHVNKKATQIVSDCMYLTEHIEESNHLSCATNMSTSFKI